MTAVYAVKLVTLLKKYLAKCVNHAKTCLVSLLSLAAERWKSFASLLPDTFLKIFKIGQPIDFVLVTRTEETSGFIVPSY